MPFRESVRRAEVRRTKLEATNRKNGASEKPENRTLRLTEGPLFVSAGTRKQRETHA